jgi:ribonuclease BN (tRNA processing enzyme)
MEVHTMKITFLGTSHGIAEKNQFCSSALVSIGDKHYVIDAGAPLMTLLKNQDVAYEDVQGIFITHTHSDHFMGLVEFTYQINNFPCFEQVNIPVYVPDAQKYKDMFQFLFGKPEFGGRLDYQVYTDGVIFDDGTLRITAIPVGHCPNAHAFMLEAEGKRVVFTGDMRADLADYPQVITEKACDLVVIEGAHFTLDKDRIVDILKHSQCKKMLVNHCNFARNTKEVLANFHQKINGAFEIGFAYDTMCVEL